LPRPTNRALGLAAALSACSAEPDADLAVPELADLDVALSPSNTRVAHLAWHTPACPLVYRVRVDEAYPDGLEKFLNTTAEHSESYFAVDPPPPGTWPPGPVPQDRVFVGGLVFQGPRTAQRPLHREFALSAALAGPASPDAACFERTWDAVEDAMALGWPQLPGRLTAVGEAWTGARVESRCNRSACVDPETRGGGKTAHHLACVTPWWRETLQAIGELAGPSGPTRVAVITSEWSDGQPIGEGLSSERTAIVAVDHGRLLHAHAKIHHGYSGIEREVRIDAVDTCPGGLVAAGWTPPQPVVTAREAILTTRENSATKGR
jgi:hypothetical protein